MSEPTFIGGFLTKVAVSLSVSGIKHAYSKLNNTPAYEKAIQQTKAKFLELELRPALDAWCASPEFDEILSLAKTGSRIPNDEAIVQSFISIGNFYSGERTNLHASAVLSTFFQELETSIISSPEGLVAVAGRQEILHLETREVLRDEERRTRGRAPTCH